MRSARACGDGARARGGCDVGGEGSLRRSREPTAQAGEDQVADHTRFFVDCEPVGSERMGG